MNRQIKEFAEQAGYNNERWNTTEEFEQFLEKFAKLVIRKCIEIDIVNPDAAPGIEIADYFGVDR